MGSKRAAARMTWPEMCRSEEYRGRWVALDNIRYEPSSTQPQEADVVDSDEDLGELCSRMREADRTACAILFCQLAAPTQHINRRAIRAERASRSGSMHR
jgi:hypothetical protein